MYQLAELQKVIRKHHTISKHLQDFALVCWLDACSAQHLPYPQCKQTHVSGTRYKGSPDTGRPLFFPHKGMKYMEQTLLKEVNKQVLFFPEYISDKEGEQPGDSSKGPSRAKCGQCSCHSLFPKIIFLFAEDLKGMVPYYCLFLFAHHCPTASAGREGTLWADPTSATPHKTTLPRATASKSNSSFLQEEILTRIKESEHNSAAQHDFNTRGPVRVHPCSSTLHKSSRGARNRAKVVQNIMFPSPKCDVLLTILLI